jgi:hypothetical protein
LHVEGSKKLRIGIDWQGNSKHRWDRHRSFALEHFQRLAISARAAASPRSGGCVWGSPLRRCLFVGVPLKKKSGDSRQRLPGFG